MKKFTKIVTIVLTLALCLVIAPSKPTAAKSKNIYFAGEYRKKIGSGEYFVLTAEQFSSPESKHFGNYEMISCILPKYSNMYVWKTGKIINIGKNTYRLGKKMRMKVYKKKIVITKGGKFNGTYKLKKRFYS